MAASLIIEQEQGTYVGSRHAHNGYYACDFSQTRPPSEPLRLVPTVRGDSVDRLADSSGASRQRLVA
jgi:hypothetical protein